MKSKNSRKIDPDESEWMADVKSVACVFCEAPPPTEAHHPKQGRHFLTIAACKKCHDARVWRIGGMSEQDASNETIRRVVRLRAGKTQQAAPGFKIKRQAGESNVLLPKIVPRKV